MAKKKKEVNEEEEQLSVKPAKCRGFDTVNGIPWDKHPPHPTTEGFIAEGGMCYSCRGRRKGLSHWMGRESYWRTET